MDIFKGNSHTFSKFSKNVINDLYKLNYDKEQLKLHQSLLGVKFGGGGQKQPYEQPSFQHLAVTLKNQYL